MMDVGSGNGGMKGEEKTADRAEKRGKKRNIGEKGLAQNERKGGQTNGGREKARKDLWQRGQ